jgi:geranyl-CoA carboxylase alpha subunit
MIRKLLVANRGEIACRIMRTCAEMGITTVGVFSDADVNACHVRLADEAVRLGEPAASASYLNISALLRAAERTGSDAIHPGYGFLAENAAFAAACRDAGITFIGPEPSVIARMGSKREAKQLMATAGIPVVPGYLGDDQSDRRLYKAAEAIGYPIMVKASAGGGGKGMRLVVSRRELSPALAAARREALAAFGDDTLLLEKLVVDPRHIEFQIFGDTHGQVIHLGERECSLQRRHQKVVEETPSGALTKELRARMGTAAVAAGRLLQYTSAGTVEFILDPDGNFYFLEVNTRLQVEHPITELVTGLDLVRWQIEVAEGRPLPLTQDMIPFRGHAVEARVYAEDPSNDFLPATGRVLLWRPPASDGSRVDAGIQTGDIISTYYDPLLAKVSAYGNDRSEALRRLDRALSEIVLLGVPSNIAFLRRLLLHPAQVGGSISTGFIEQHAEYLLQLNPAPSERATAAVAVAIKRYKNNQRAFMSRWRNNPSGPIRERFLPSLEVHLQPLDADRFDAAVIMDGQDERTLAVILHTEDHNAQHRLLMEVDGHLMSVVVAQATAGNWWVQVNSGVAQILQWSSPLPEPKPGANRLALAAGHSARESAQSVVEGHTDGAVIAPMPGMVVSVLVSEGQLVRSGDPLLILSAMKMEHTLRAAHDGMVAHIYYQAGEQVVATSVLLELEVSAGEEEAWSRKRI